MRRLTTSDGETIHYRRVGQPGRPVVFLVHGWRSTHEVFQKVVPELERQFLLVLPDMRGHGASRQTSKPVTLARLARDLAEIAAAEGVERIHFVGHSMGVSVCYAFLQQCGTEAVASFCNIDMTPRILTAADWEHGVFGRWERRDCDEFLKRLRADFNAAIVWYLSHSRHPPDPDLLRDRLAATRLDFDEPRCIDLYDDIARSDFRDLYRSLKLPVLNLFGAHSEFYSGSTAAWHACHNARARTVVLGRSGHFPTLSEPQQVTGWLIEHFGRGIGG